MPSSIPTLRLLALAATAGAALLLATGCGPSGDATSGAVAAAPSADDGTAAAAAAATAAGFTTMEEDLARTVREQSAFYAFADEAAWTADTAGLEWEDGSDLPEFADVDAPKGGTVRIWITDFPRTLRTIGPDATGGIRPYLLDDVGMRFLTPHPNMPGHWFPGIASRYAASREKRTVWFEIDPAARWSDGRPLTTDDVVFTFYFMRTPIMGEPWYNDFYTKTYERLTVYGPRRFALTQPAAKPDMVDRAGNWVPYPRHAFQDFGPNWTIDFQWRILPTTSPYLLRESDIDKGESITFRRDPEWWARDRRFYRGRFNPDRMRLVVIRDPNKAFEAFRRGDLDFFGLGSPTLWYEKLPDDDELVTAGFVHKVRFYNQTPQPDWGLWINRSKPILDNRDVREGLHFATNFDLVCRDFYRGDATVMQTRSDGYGWRMHPTLTHRAFDPARARELFARAGFTQQGPDGILADAQGRRLSFRLLTYQRPGAQEILSIIEREAKKAGVEYVIEIGDGSTAFKTMQEKNHEIAFVALSRSVELYPRYWEMYHGSNAWEDAYLGPDGKPTPLHSAGTPNPAPSRIQTQTNNMTMSFIPELDRLIEVYDRSDSLDEMKRLAVEMEQLIHDDAAWVNGPTQPFLRAAFWRWVRWPAEFNVMQARDMVEWHLFSIDPALEEETRAARRSGATFPPVLQTFEQHRR